MKARRVRLMTERGMAESLSNLCGGDVFPIKDAIEDATTARDLVCRLNRLGLYRKFKFDRETPKYIRLAGTDYLDNKSYLMVYKEY